MTGAGRRVEGAGYAGASRDVLQSCLSSRAGSPPTVHGRHETGRRNARGGGRRQDPAALALEALAPLKPRVLSVSARGVPAWSILSSTVVGFACVVAAYISPKGVFLFLLNSSGAIILFVYLLICVSQLRMRRTIPPERLRVKMWGYPVLTVLTALALRRLRAHGLM